jgi:hypothetical protein
MPDLPDYAEEDGLTALARDADLALLDEAIHQVKGAAEALDGLRRRAELGTTSRYIELALPDLTDTAAWLADARRELAATPTRAEQAEYLAEQAELQRRLWRRRPPTESPKCVAARVPCRRSASQPPHRAWPKAGSRLSGHSCRPPDTGKSSGPSPSHRSHRPATGTVNLLPSGRATWHAEGDASTEFSLPQQSR